MKSAVILAAGIGSRLSPVTDSIPKCCVEVNNKTIIRRITDQLLSCDQHMIINIVVGHLSDKVMDEMAGYPENVKIVENKEYRHTNNMESCRMGLAQNGIIEGDSLIVNGDCVYSDRIVSLMHNTQNSTIAIDSSKFQEENMKILNKNGRPVAISKDLLESEGAITSIDFYNFKNNDIRKLYSIMEDYFKNLNRNLWTEVAINDLLSLQNSKINTLDVTGEKWMEIDDHHDLIAARNLW